MDHPSLTYDRPFRTLFEDGVHLLLAAEAVGENDQEHAASIARGSIACTMMLPEVAANICIESLGLEKMIFNDIDRLAPLAKFDYYLTLRRGGVKFCKPVVGAAGGVDEEFESKGKGVELGLDAEAFEFEGGNDGHEDMVALGSLGLGG